MAASPCDKSATRPAVRRSLDALAWPLLADWYRRVTLRRPGTPEDIKQDILEAIRTGKLPAQADRIVTYCIKPRDRFAVAEHEPLPREIFVVGAPGGAASLHLDWLRSSCVRRAGATWGRIEAAGIRVDPACAAALWPDQAASKKRLLPPTRAPAPASSTPPPRRTVTDKELQACILALKKDWPGDPPNESALLRAVENHLGLPVARDRVRNARKQAAPQWAAPVGRPRKSAT